MKGVVGYERWAVGFNHATSLCAGCFIPLNHPSTTPFSVMLQQPNAACNPLRR